MNSEHCMREVKDTCYNSFVKKGGLFFFGGGGEKDCYVFIRIIFAFGNGR